MTLLRQHILIIDARAVSALNAFRIPGRLMNELWRTFGMTLCGMKGAAPRNNKMAALDWPGMSEALLKRMRQYEALIRDGEKSKYGILVLVNS